MHWHSMAAALTLLLVLVGLAAIVVEASQRDVTPTIPSTSGSCFSYEDAYNGTLECKEVSADGQQLRCYLLYRALDYVPFYRYGFALQVTFTLHLMSEEEHPIEDNSDNGKMDDKMQPKRHDDEQVICWSLAAIEANRMDDASEVDWSKNEMSLAYFGVFLLLYPTKVFHVSATYPSRTPAVMTSINTSCWAYERSTNCIKSALISIKVLLPGMYMSRNPYSDEYWNDFRKMHIEDLKAENISFMLESHDYNNNKATFIDHYIQPFVKNVSFERIYFEKVNLTGLDIGKQLKMKELKVVGSMLTTNDTENFISSSPNLESLNLTHNKITYIPAGISKLHNLKQLDLSYNAMNMPLSPSLVSFETNLKVLNIAGNIITNISILNHMISKCQLLFLNASDCSLSELEADGQLSALRHQTELNVIDLSLNGFNILPKDIFLEMKQLQLLQLSHNHLHDGLRLHLPQTDIKVVDLSYNHLQTPENIVESGTASWVILKGNDIYPWHNSSIFLKRANLSETWVTKLDLSDCKINAVNEEMINSLQYLKEVDLGGNPFDCVDCSMSVFKTWLQSKYKTSESYPKLLNHGVEDIFTCVHPEGFAGKPILSADNPDCQTNYFTAVGIPIIVILALSASSIGALYFYRYEITYILHLVKMRKLRLANGSMIKSFQYDAFVCYSGKDRNWVMKKLVPQLENGPQKYILCLHERDFILGSIITRNIANFMQQSKNMIVVLTTNFVNSHWCQWELEMANHKVFAENREFLIFIELERLERQKLPQHLRYLMDTRTYLEWPLPEDMNSETESILWRRLRISMGPSIAQIKRGFKLQTA